MIKISKIIQEEVESLINIDEENVPNDSQKWLYAKSEAKKRFKVWPSAYSSAWASKKYKELGGTWRKK